MRLTRPAGLPRNAIAMVMTMAVQRAAHIAPLSGLRSRDLTRGTDRSAASFPSARSAE
jgi:hypothetical protein